MYLNPPTQFVTASLSGPEFYISISSLTFSNYFFSPLDIEFQLLIYFMSFRFLFFYVLFDLRQFYYALDNNSALNVSSTTWTICLH